MYRCRFSNGGQIPNASARIVTLINFNTLGIMDLTRECFSQSKVLVMYVV